ARTSQRMRCLRNKTSSILPMIPVRVTALHPLSPAQRQRLFSPFGLCAMRGSLSGAMVEMSALCKAIFKHTCARSGPPLKLQRVSAAPRGQNLPRDAFGDTVAMNFGPLVHKYGLVQSRASPIPPSALLLTFGLGATALVASIATKFVITSLP